jgi:hypothetical protein
VISSGVRILVWSTMFHFHVTAVTISVMAVGDMPRFAPAGSSSGGPQAFPEFEPRSAGRAAREPYLASASVCKIF